MTTQSSWYAKVFADVERQVLAMGSATSKAKKAEEARKYLDDFKAVSTRSFSDDEYFSKLIMVAFYSGFSAATVTRKQDVIKRHFPSWKKVAGYGEADIQRILEDADMIAHRGKVNGCVENAKVFAALVGRDGSFAAFIESQSPNQSLEQLLLLDELLQTKFAYLGRVTVYHFMTDIGLNVLKPDRVICRIFHRLGLLESEDQVFKAILEGRRFAEATGLPIRYIDIVFVVFGQVQSPKAGIDKGICLKEPRCAECALRPECKFPAAINTA